MYLSFIETDIMQTSSEKLTSQLA